MEHSIKVTLPPLAVNIYERIKPQKEMKTAYTDEWDEFDELYIDTGGGG